MLKPTEVNERELTMPRRALSRIVVVMFNPT